MAEKKEDEIDDEVAIINKSNNEDIVRELGIVYGQPWEIKIDGKVVKTGEGVDELFDCFIKADFGQVSKKEK